MYFFLHYGDLTDSTNLTQLISQIRPDEIYNLGAMSHVKVCMLYVDVCVYMAVWMYGHVWVNHTGRVVGGTDCVYMCVWVCGCMSVSPRPSHPTWHRPHLTTTITRMNTTQSQQVSFQMSEYTADVDGIGALRLLNAVRACGLEKHTRLYQVCMPFVSIDWTRLGW